MLLIDDIQFFEGRDGFEKEFFHTFNDLHAQGKQIVVTTDRPPALLTGLTEALRTRLQWGLAADIQRPAFDTRLAILRAKARRHALQLPAEALEMIAEHCCPTVRELEGSLNRVLAYVPLIGGIVTNETIERALSPLTPLAQREAEPPCADDIVARRVPPPRRAAVRRARPQPQPRRLVRAPPRHVPAEGRRPQEPSPRSAACSATATTRPSSPASSASPSNKPPAPKPAPTSPPSARPWTVARAH